MHFEKKPGARFSKVPRTFRVRKASCQTAIRLFWKADLFTCFNYKKNQGDCEVWRPRTSALRRYKRNCGTRNRPEKFRDFWETGPWTEFDPDLYDTGAELPQFSYQAKWELVDIWIYLYIMWCAISGTFGRSPISRILGVFYQGNFDHKISQFLEIFALSTPLHTFQK